MKEGVQKNLKNFRDVIYKEPLGTRKSNRLMGTAETIVINFCALANLADYFIVRNEL